MRSPMSLLSSLRSAKRCRTSPSVMPTPGSASSPQTALGPPILVALTVQAARMRVSPALHSYLPRCPRPCPYPCRRPQRSPTPPCPAVSRRPSHRNQRSATMRISFDIMGPTSASAERCQMSSKPLSTSCRKAAFKVQVRVRPPVILRRACREDVPGQ